MNVGFDVMKKKYTFKTYPGYPLTNLNTVNKRHDINTQQKNIESIQSSTERSSNFEVS
jgi:hypothetical protein